MRAMFNSPLGVTMQMHRPLPVRRDTRAWRAQVWISFGLSAALCAVGLAYLPGRDLDRAFMVMGYVFCLSAAFALAKFVRDNEGGRNDIGRASCRERV